MAIYLRILPSVKVRIGRRGRRWLLGERLFRYHTGAGGKGVSTGVGPFSLYKPLSRRRRSRGRR